MMGMVWVKLTLLTVNDVTVHPTLSTPHHIMLHLFPPRIHRPLKAFESLLETYLPLQLPE